MFLPFCKQKKRDIFNSVAKIHENLRNLFVKKLMLVVSANYILWMQKEFFYNLQISYVIETFNENTVFGIISNSKQKHNYSANDDDADKDIFYAVSQENHITFVF